MTGRYTTRLGTHANVVYWDTPWAVPREEEFLPEILSEHGRYTTRLGTHANVVFWDTPWAVPKEEEFLPQVLSKHGGYTSYGVGKYHLGMMSEWALPTSRGFDKWDGYLQGCGSAWTHVASCCHA